MGAKICRIFSLILFGVLSFHLGRWLFVNIGITKDLYWSNLIGIIAVGVMFGYLISPTLYKEIVNFNKWVEDGIQILTPKVVISSVIGLVFALILANIILLPLLFYLKDKGVLFTLSVILNILFGYVGLFIGGKIAIISSSGIKEKQGRGGTPKILDTSAIIDGRIADVYKTGFMEGKLIVPAFVFSELKKIADSQDILRKNRGRRGLDVLKKMQDEFGDNLEITSHDFKDIVEVDDKIMKLAKMLGADVITNDYNLNKAATLQDVRVLNINELTNAVKSIVLPGEEIRVEVIKEGKERDQGVGYLDDGTMVVVEDGRYVIGEEVDIVVTNILQTSAGRVIFGRPKEIPARSRKYY